MSLILAKQLPDFYAWSGDVGAKVLHWFNPDMTHFVTKGWAFTHLGDALLAMAAYAVVVLVGVVMQACRKTTDKSSAKSQKVEKVSVGESFRREPIKYLQVVYNLTQVLLCAYMVFTTVEIAITENYKLIGNPFNPAKERMAFILWVFYLSKILDFLDTFFIVVRGKWEQFSFLHIYHHFTIFAFYWVNANAGYDGDIYYTIVANGLVHLVMYFYYLLSCFGYRAWWARYLTQMQMIQFVTMMAQAIFITFTDCEYPKRIATVYFFYILSLLGLFMQFYMARYKKTGKSAKTKKD
jgi:elongation of very long chain fatty acids protein 4